MSIRVRTREDFVFYGASSSLADELVHLKGHIKAQDRQVHLFLGGIKHKIVWDSIRERYRFCQEHFDSFAKHLKGAHAKGRLFPIRVGKHHNKIRVKDFIAGNPIYETREDVEDLCGRILAAWMRQYQPRQEAPKPRVFTFQRDPFFNDFLFNRGRFPFMGNVFGAGRQPPAPRPQPFTITFAAGVNEEDRAWIQSKREDIEASMAQKSVGASIQRVLSKRSPPMVAVCTKMSQGSSRVHVAPVDCSALSSIGLNNTQDMQHRLLLALLENKNDPAISEWQKTWKFSCVPTEAQSYTLKIQHRVLADIKAWPAVETVQEKKNRLQELVSKLTTVDASGLVHASALYDQLLEFLKNDRKRLSLLQRTLRSAVIGDLKVDGAFRTRAIHAMQLVDAQSARLA